MSSDYFKKIAGVIEPDAAKTVPPKGKKTPMNIKQIILD
jgi:hypothetical protein